MELSFWSCTCNDSGSGVLLKQRIPEVALFHGCTLEAWYHNVNGLITLKANPSIPAFLQQLGTTSLGPSAPASILRFESSLGKSREGIPTQSLVAQVLSLQKTGELLERVALEETPTLESGNLSGLWTLQSYVEPRYGIRILSLYSCDAQLEERSDIFSHRFRPTYEPSATTIEETGPDGPRELETPYRQAIESKTLGIVRFAREYHNLDLDGTMLEFIFDLRGQIVLHGCWAMSLCNQLGFRRLRPASAQPGVIWREPKAFPVPKVAPQWPPAVSTGSRGPPLRPAKRSASVTGLFSEMAEKQHCPPMCEFLLEFWQADGFLGEVAFQCHPSEQSDLRVLKLTQQRPFQRADGRKFMREPPPQDGAVAVVSTSWSDGGWLNFKLGRAEHLATKESDAQVNAILWLRQGQEYVPVWSSGDADSVEEFIDGKWCWVHVWGGENVEISLRHAGTSTPRPSSTTPRSIPKLDVEGAATNPGAETVKTPQDQVCGATFAAHWGMSEEGAMCGHQLAFQVCQRFKLGRSTRSGLLKCLAERVANFHNMNREWEIFVQAMKVKHHEAERELQHQEKIFREAMEKYDSSVDMFQRSLASCTRRHLCEEEDFRLREDEDVAEATQVKERMKEQQQKLMELQLQEEQFQISLEQVRSKYNDLVAEDARLHSQLQETRERRLYQQAELLRQRHLQDDLAELKALKAKLMKLQRASKTEQKLTAKFEDYLRKVANQDAKILRTGGGYILNSMAKVEAQAFLRELRL